MRSSFEETKVTKKKFINKQLTKFNGKYLEMNTVSYSLMFCNKGIRENECCAHFATKGAVKNKGFTIV
jgi:hypothetical protein